MTDAAPPDPSDMFAQARFQAALGTDFAVMDARGEHVALVLRLSEVNPRPAPRGYEQFSALFRAPASPVLSQATYAIRHATLGELPLFIVPIAADAQGATYEACIVRRVAAHSGRDAAT
ncbi:MAG TPA: hypothetical protein VGI14_02530 [Casimicrobiaceae bacterium]|jgi:hypothetical protein